MNDNNIRNKRLLKEWELWERGHPEGIWIHLVNDQVDHVIAMILGPKGPFSLGFFLFDITYPRTYPNDPPKVIFMNTDSHIRIHPNLYGDGKVCLSILGTWRGPGWTRIMKTETVLVSIQSLLGMDEPIQAEPGYANKTCKEYNEYIRQATLSQFINKSIFSGTSFPQPFIETMKSFFKEQKDEYETLLARAESLGQVKFEQGPPHNSIITMDYKNIHSNFDSI